MPMREQRAVFGEVAAEYEDSRPGYPKAMIDDVLAHAARYLRSPVVEVGAGTGKATVAFAHCGLQLTALEPDPRMAAMTAHKCRDHPRTTVVVSKFEEWTAPLASVGLLFSAQAWHWVDPRIRGAKAAEILMPDGTIALWWNDFMLDDRILRNALLRLHVKHGCGDLAHHTLLPERDPERPEGFDDPDDQPFQELKSGGFVDIRHRQYRVVHSLTTKGYVNLLASISDYRMLDEENRANLLADIATELGSRRVGLDTVTHLYLARNPRAGRDY
ncbi:class I SAM-dependent methyltransferase, partial [Nonomuraea sp. RK-328]|nr:class I SAM-dependent methyltransferase [Nonomuraea sp. RK-328]